MWLDSDMIFPETIIDNLLKHNCDIVACNYSTRTKPFKGVAYKKIGDWDSWVRRDDANTLVEVEGVGMGCMLVRTDVFCEMTLPWFEIEYSTEYQTHIGEDFWFCRNARSLGYKILIDTELSKKIKHCGSHDFTLE